MAAGSIVVDLLLKTSTFETDSKRAAQALKKLQQEAKVIGVAIGAAFVAAGTAVSVLVGKSINAMDEMSKLAQQTGTTTEELSALAYAADLAGVNQQSLGSAMVKLSKNMSDAAAGTGDAKDAFKALGIEVANGDGTLKTSSAVISEVAAKFATYKDGAEKTALAVKIFGKAGAELIPLLNGGADGLDKLTAEAERLGLVIDGKTAKAAEAFNDNLNRMGKAIDGVGNTIAAELLPTLVDMTDGMVAVVKEGTALAVVADVIRAAVGGVINVFENFCIRVATDVGFVSGVGREIGAVAARLAALARMDFAGFRAISQAVKEDGERARAELDKFQARVMALGQASGKAYDQSAARLLRQGAGGGLASAPRITSGSGKAGRGAKDGITDAQRELARYVEQLGRAIEKTDELSESERALNVLRSLGALGQIPQVREMVTGLAAQADAVKRLRDEQEALLTIDKAQEDQARATLQAQDERFSALIANTASAKLEESRKDMLLLTDALERKAITEATYLEAVSARLGITNEQLKESNTLADDLGLTFTSAFEDAIVGGKKFSDVLKGLEQDIIRIITRKMVTEPLGNFITGALKGGGGGGFLGSIGSFFSGIFGGARADGGPVSSGSAYLVGERGPEMFVPRSSGTIVPNGGGRNVVVNINQSFAPGTTRATTLNAAADASRTLQRAGRNL